MYELWQIATFLKAHWAAVIGIMALLLKLSQGIVALALVAWPMSGFLIEAKAWLDSLANNLPTPSMLAKLRQPPPPNGKSGVTLAASGAIK